MGLESAIIPVKDCTLLICRFYFVDPVQQALVNSCGTAHTQAYHSVGVGNNNLTLP